MANASDKLTRLEPMKITTIVGTAHTVTEADFGKVLLFDTTNAVTLTVPDVATEDLPDGFYVYARNKQAGVITVTPTGTDVIGGAGTVTSDPEKLLSVYKEADGLYITAGDLA